MDPQVKPASNNFAVLALVFGAVSLALCSTLIIPLIFGSIGAILAILSKEDSLKMIGQAKAGFVLCLAAVVVAVAMLVSSVTLYFTNPEYHQELNNTYKEIYGITMDEYIDSLYQMYNEVE